MASVTFPTALGGDGKTYTDDAHPDTGLDGLGYVTRLVPLFKNGLAMAGYTAQYAAKIDAAAANADRAEDAKAYVEAVAEEYKVNLLDAYRDRITLGADFKAGRYTLDDGISRIDTTDPTDIFSITRSTEKWAESLDGVYRPTPESALARSWHNGEPSGFLADDTATNWLLRSAQLENSYWSKTLCTAPDSGLSSPIEGVNYRRITPSTTGQITSGVTGSVSSFSGAWAVSFFARPVNNISRLLVVADGVDERVLVDLNTRSIIGRTAGASTAFLVSRGERYAVVFPTLSGITGARLFLKNGSDGSTSTSTMIAANDSLLIVGIQGEKTSWATSYIPTTDSPITRPADDVRRTSLSGLSRREGTLFVEWVQDYEEPLGILVSLDAGGNNERIRIQTIDVGVSFGYTSAAAGGGISSSGIAVALQRGVVHRTAVSYKRGVQLCACDGIAGQSRDYDFVPEFTGIGVGNRAGGQVQPKNTNILNFWYVPFALSQSEINGVTAL